MKINMLCAVVANLVAGVAAIQPHVHGMQQSASLSHREQMVHLLSLPQQLHGPLVDQVGPMLKSADAMLTELAGKKTDGPVYDLVKQIRPFIIQMQGSIQGAHDDVQQTLNKFGDDFTGCITAKAAGDSEASSLETMKQNFSTEHRSCRQRQSTADSNLAGCRFTLAALQSAKDSSCLLLEQAKKTPGCGSIPPIDGESWESYVSRAAAHFVQEKDDFFQKKDVCNNDTAKLDTQKIVCLGTDGSGGQEKVAEDMLKECNGKQVQLESATCTYVSKVKEVCQSFNSCTNTLSDTYDAKAQGVLEQEQQRKVEWNATERLLCLLEVYGAGGDVDASKLNTCQHLATNTSHLNLVYPTPNPRPSRCAGFLPHPCGADYISAEYSGLAADAGACNACAFAITPAPGKYFMPTPGATKCPGGTGIATQEECQQAYDSFSHYWTHPAKRGMVVGKFLRVPTQCSIQYQGDYVSSSSDQSPHWNLHGGALGSRGASMEFVPICKTETTPTTTPDFA